jgi:hypothetical protein
MKQKTKLIITGVVLMTIAFGQSLDVSGYARSYMGVLVNVKFIWIYFLITWIYA